MPYDQNFYDLYEAYLLEPVVRKHHDFALTAFDDLADTRRIIDLGAGMGKEFNRYGKMFESYCPFDKSNGDDYYSSGFIERAKEQSPTTFVSLFSTEITAPQAQAFELYEKLFAEIRTLTHGLVSGFYYAKRKHENPVAEAGGIESWQTLHDIENHKSPLFNEIRITMRVPSKMFGNDVIEVWRLFTKNTLP